MKLIEQYKSYIACLNQRALGNLGNYVADDAFHNGHKIGLAGYREMLAGNYRDIPDLVFHIDLLISDGETLGSRLRFDCRPSARFLDLPINGRRVVFHENVFYQFRLGKIVEVWSVINPQEICEQLVDPPPH